MKKAMKSKALIRENKISRLLNSRKNKINKEIIKKEAAGGTRIKNQRTEISTNREWVMEVCHLINPKHQSCSPRHYQGPLSNICLFQHRQLMQSLIRVQPVEFNRSISSARRP